MRIVFIGTGEIGRPTLRTLLTHAATPIDGVITQPDKPVGRDQQVQAPPIKAESAASPVPVLQPVRIRNDEVLRSDSAACAGRHRRHGLRPNPAEERARDSTDCLFESPRLALCRAIAARRLSRPRSRPATLKTGIPSSTWIEGLDTG
jgi:hypothetical protein